ncbi:F-box LRR-repeat 17 [Pelobates cultripes]|uniref:F-box LRR-repeat 17 n=1 Tax=Pelobates cultripes TaxID=61616 RepID=A0AAD1SDN3_PELCU|nr:F-box LRR-repeat 17 [Pelobates cultripes]
MGGGLCRQRSAHTPESRGKQQRPARDCFLRGPCMLCFIVQHSQRDPRAPCRPRAPSPASPELPAARLLLPGLLCPGLLRGPGLLCPVSPPQADMVCKRKNSGDGPQRPCKLPRSATSEEPPGVLRAEGQDGGVPAATARDGSQDEDCPAAQPQNAGTSAGLLPREHGATAVRSQEDGALAVRSQEDGALAVRSQEDGALAVRSQEDGALAVRSQEDGALAVRSQEDGALAVRSQEEGALAVRSQEDGALAVRSQEDGALAVRSQEDGALAVRSQEDGALAVRSQDEDSLAVPYQTCDPSAVLSTLQSQDISPYTVEPQCRRVLTTQSQENCTSGPELKPQDSCIPEPKPKTQEEETDQFHIHQLPSSILLKIFSNLSLIERCLSASLVCKYWRDLCLDFQFWRQLDLSGRQQVLKIIIANLSDIETNQREYEDKLSKDSHFELFL